VCYYRWTYREDWETRAKVYLNRYPYFCSKHNNSRELLIGTNEKNASNQIIEILAEISPKNDRFSFLYCIDVTQNAISKRAYDYFINIKKNSRHAGSLFAQVPAELKGNISCTTDPGRTVIGFMEISSATRRKLYIDGLNIYEPSYNTSQCNPIAFNFGGRLISMGDGTFIDINCINCTLDGGKSILALPDDWPKQYEVEDWYLSFFDN